MLSEWQCVSIEHSLIENVGRMKAIHDDSWSLIQNNGIIAVVIS